MVILETVCSSSISTCALLHTKQVKNRVNQMPQEETLLVLINCNIKL